MVCLVDLVRSGGLGRLVGLVELVGLAWFVIFPFLMLSTLIWAKFAIEPPSVEPTGAPPKKRMDLVQTELQ